MRNVLILGALLSTCALLIGCPKKDEGADAASDAAPEAAVTAEVDTGAPPAIAVVAKNSADVARFAAETAVGDDDLRLAQLTPVRTTPRAGSVVATLGPGADVTKVADYNNCFLVTFPDPKDPASVLMGWIGKEAFTAAIIKRDAGVDAGPAVVVDAGPPPKLLTCPVGLVAVMLTATPSCKRKCNVDADCKAAKGCAATVDQKGAAVKACTLD